MVRLTLRREALAELASGDLALVAGGTLRSQGPVCSLEPSYGAFCPSGGPVDCESMFRPCVSNTCTR